MTVTPTRRFFLQGCTLLAVWPRLGNAADAPRSPFGPRSTAEEVTAGLDLSGTTALVSGCNSGIGYETMRVLALRGAHVLGTGRALAKARQACESVEGRAMELARRLEGTNATANALHPGVVDTNLFRHSTATITTSAGRKTVEQGAATSCYVAAHPALAGVSGCYFEDCNPAEPSALMLDVALAAELWAVSERLVADYLP